MAEYYTSGISRSRTRRKRRSGRSLWLVMLDALMCVLMAVLVAASLVAIICQYITPAKVGILSVVALVAPVLYLFDIVILLYWVIRWRWVSVAVMAVVVFVCTLYSPRYYVTDVMRDYNTKYIERHYTKILTYNIQGDFSDEILSQVKDIRADVVCFQEAADYDGNWAVYTEPYKTTYNGSDRYGCQIVTRHRILRHGQVGALPRQNGVWADLRIGDDTIRVVNLHLKSTSIRAEDTKFLEHHEYILDNERKSKLGSIVSRLTENNVARAEQAEMVADFLESTPYDIIVCGDFNDVPLSYTYNTIRGDLQDAFVEGGDGYAYTYNTAYRLLRIDNIFLTPSMEVVSYEVDNEQSLSDHFPVVVRAKRR